MRNSYQFITIFLLIFIVKEARGNLYLISISYHLSLPAALSNDTTLIPNFPWLENVAKIEFTTPKPRPNVIRNGLIEQVKTGKIPKELVPFVNLTAIDELKKEHNDVRLFELELLYLKN